MPDMSVSSCILPMRFKDKIGDTVTIKRRVVGALVKGVQYENPPTLLKIVGNIQQAQPKQLMRLPEGDRTKDYIIVNTQEKLQTADVMIGNLPDRVVFNGRDYEVMEISDWTADGGFFNALCVKVGQ